MKNLLLILATVSSANAFAFPVIYCREVTNGPNYTRATVTNSAGRETLSVERVTNRGAQVVYKDLVRVMSTNTVTTYATADDVARLFVDRSSRNGIQARLVLKRRMLDMTCVRPAVDPMPRR